MFTSSKRDGSWITHMQGTQSVIAHRDNTSLKDASSYLSILCSHLVCNTLSEVTMTPPPRCWFYLGRLLLDRTKMSTTASRSLDPTDSVWIWSQKTSDHFDVRFRKSLLYTRDMWWLRKLYQSNEPRYPQRNPRTRPKARGMDRRSASRMVRCDSQPRLAYQTSKLVEKSTFRSRRSRANVLIPEPHGSEQMDPVPSNSHSPEYHPSRIFAPTTIFEARIFRIGSPHDWSAYIFEHWDFLFTTLLPGSLFWWFLWFCFGDWYSHSLGLHDSLARIRQLSMSTS